MSTAPLRPSKRCVLNGLKMLQFQSPCALRSMIDFLLSARKLVVKPRDIRADPKSPTHASGGSRLAINLARRPRGLTPREAAGAEWGRPQPRERQREHRTGVGAPEADGILAPMLGPFDVLSRSASRPDQLVAAIAARLVKRKAPPRSGA